MNVTSDVVTPEVTEEGKKDMVAADEAMTTPEADVAPEAAAEEEVVA